LFILPSYNEPASISVLESISIGIPVLCSDSCGTKIYVKENLNGFVFKTNNKISLINKIKFYITNKKKFEYYSKNCLEYSSSKLSSGNFNFYFNKILQSFNKK
jgi:glycosyltransferase involved in cell wall biosynthesis